MEQFDKICEVQSDKASVEVSYSYCLFCLIELEWVEQVDEKRNA